MEIHSRLYLLHINKTGGTSVLHSIKDVIEEAGLPWFPKPEKPQQMIKDFNGFVYIQRHLGLFPVGRADNLSIACIFRNPVERIVSNFTWSFNGFVKDNPKYANLRTIDEKLRFYLFHDYDHKPQNNMQTRFVCNSISDELFFDLFNCGPGLYHKIKKTNSGFIPDDYTSFELAKQNIRNFEIVGTTEEHEMFLLKVRNWFVFNYNLDFTDSPIVKSNISKFEFNGHSFSSSELLSMLTPKEIERVIDNNKLDMEIYEFAKQEQYRK
jgi:hypothetical protein